MKVITNEVKTDILVMGAGLAGCWAAIRARQLGADVVLADKGYVGRIGVSKFASSHIRTYFPEDDHEDAIKEIVSGGDYLNDQRWTEIAVRGIFDRVKEMDSLGVKFEKENGRFKQVPSKGRINASVVFNSAQTMMAMRKAVKDLGIRILDRVFIYDLLVKDGRIIGAMGIDTRNGNLYEIYCPAVILAAGACTLRSIFHGHQFSTGDAYGMAYRAGVTFMNMECIQHNTCARDFNTSGMGHWVGSGGKFINSRGEAFMARYHELKDRANLTWIARAMATEVREGRGPIYFDFSGISQDNLESARKSMPWAVLALTRAGIDVTNDRVEWVPAFLGSCGAASGIKINTFGETDLPGLYATGDAGAMLALGMGAGFGGFNLTYCIVFGYRAGEGAFNFITAAKAKQVEKASTRILKEIRETLYAPLTAKDGSSADSVLYEIQKIIFPYEISILKSGDKLKMALDKVRDVKKNLVPKMIAPDTHELVKVQETANMVLYAEMFLRASLFRTESRGMHYRDDYPQKDNKSWLKWTNLRRVNDEMRLFSEPLPNEAFSHFSVR